MKPSGVTSTRDLLLEDIAAGPFEEGGDAAAAQLAARASTLAAPRREAVPVGERQALVEDLLELAAVVGLRHRVRVRHLLGPDHVAAAQLGRVELHLARRRVHQPLDDVDRLGPAGAAIGAGRRGVGQHGGEVEVDRRRCRRCWSRPTGRSAAGSRRRPAWRRRRRWRSERTRSASTRPLASSASSARLVTSRPCVGRQELLAAIGLPAHRALQRRAPRRRRRCLPDRRRSSCRSRRRRRRRPRAPAGRRQAGNAPRRWPPRTPVGIWLLMRTSMRPLASSSAGDDRARLHRRRRDALVDEVERDPVRGAWRTPLRSPRHRRGASRRRCCRAPPAHSAGAPGASRPRRRPPPAAPRSRRRSPRARRAPHRASRPRPRRPARRRSARIRAPARGAAALDGRPAVGAPEIGRRRHRLDAGRGELGAGEDREHAGHRPRRGGVDRRRSARARTASAGRRSPSRRRRGNVVGEAAAAARAARASSMRGTARPLPKRGAASVGVEVSMTLVHQACSAAHISWSRSAVQMRGSRCAVASS